MKIYTLTPSPDEENAYPLEQTLDGAHKLGIHHICVSRDGKTAATAGFGGEVKIWMYGEDGQWQNKGRVIGTEYTFWRDNISNE